MPLGTGKAFMDLFFTQKPPAFNFLSFLFYNSFLFFQHLACQVVFETDWVRFFYGGVLF